MRGLRHGRTGDAGVDADITPVGCGPILVRQDRAVVWIEFDPPHTAAPRHVKLGVVGDIGDVGVGWVGLVGTDVPVLNFLAEALVHPRDQEAFIGLGILEVVEAEFAAADFPLRPLVGGPDHGRIDIEIDPVGHPVRMRTARADPSGIGNIVQGEEVIRIGAGPNLVAVEVPAVPSDGVGPFAEGLAARDADQGVDPGGAQHGIAHAPFAKSRAIVLGIGVPGVHRQVHFGRTAVEREGHLDRTAVKGDILGVDSEDVGHAAAPIVGAIEIWIAGRARLG